MHLKELSNLGLHEKLMALAGEERILTIEVLKHLREVDRRRLYSERGHSSLFEYAVRELTYSESAAQRRIFAMRALKDLPELEAQIQSGELKVTQLAQVQSFFRAESKAGIAYSMSQKRELIQSTVGKSTRETEKILAEKNPVYAARERVRVLSPTETQLTFTASDSLMADLQSVRDRFAHRLPAGASLAEVVQFMAKVTLESVPEKKGGRGTTPLPAPVTPTRYIPADVKRAVWKRDEGQCTYVSPHPEKRCPSRHRIQIDHVVPFSLGGSSNCAGNLRLLCFSHNQYEAVRILGR